MYVIQAVLNFVVMAGIVCFAIWAMLVAIGAVLEGLDRLAYKLWG